MTQSSSRVVTFETDNVDHTLEKLAPVVSPTLSLKPCHRLPFHAEAQLIRLSQIGLFKVKLSTARILNPEPVGFYGITVPLGTPFQTVTHGQTDTFATNTAYVNRYDEPFELLTSGDTEMLVVNLDPSIVDDHVFKLNGGDEPKPLRFGSTLSLVSPSGGTFWRYLSFLWSEVLRGGTITESELILRELENTLVTMLLYAWQEQAVDTRQRETGRYPAALRIAEDYVVAHLADPVSVADLAMVSGVSARSLFKMFQERHGTGPIGFLKARRLEVVQRALLAADPQCTTVTQVAMDFGFCHLGQFSKDYRQAFQESPSETLRR